MGTAPRDAGIRSLHPVRVLLAADDPRFLARLNVFAGKVTYAPGAEAVGVDAFDPHAAVIA